MQTIYAYSYNPAIATGTNTTGTNWRMAYQQPIMLYKGTANTIRLVVFASNQRVVNLIDYDVQVQIVDRETEEHLVTRTATIITPTSGVASVTFTEADLRGLQNRFYHVIARLVDPDDGSSLSAGEILYLDDNYGAFTPVTIENAWNYQPTSISTTNGVQSISFTNIGETPDSFTGQANKFLRVNSTANAVEFASFGTFNSNIIPSANTTYNLGTSSNQWNTIHASFVAAGNINISGNAIDTNNTEFSINVASQILGITDNSTDPSHMQGDGGFIAFNDNTHVTDGPTIEVWYGNVSRPSDPPGQHSLDIHAAANSYVEFASYDLNSFMGIDAAGPFIQTDWNGPTTSEWRFASNAVMHMPANSTVTSTQSNIQLYMPETAIQFLFKQPNDTYLTHSFDVSGKVSFDGNVVPNSNVTYSLGSPTEQWKDLYVSNTTIFLGGVPLSVDAGGNLLVNGNAVTGGGGGGPGIDPVLPYVELTNDPFITQSAILDTPVTITAAPRGVNAQFTVIFQNTGSTMSYSIAQPGTGYVVGQNYKIFHHQIGSGNASGDISFTISEVDGNGGIVGVDNVIWTGPNSDGTYTNVSISYQPSEFDEIDTGLVLTRGLNQGIFNIEAEAQYDNNTHLSPLGTEWNADGWGDLIGLGARSYTTWRQALNNQVGNYILNAELVMHDTINDKYYKFDFTNWGENNGSFAYTRTLVTDPNYFKKTDNGEEVDIIVPDDGSTLGVAITRNNNQGIFNPLQEEGWDSDVSPAGTLWNIDGWDDLTDIEDRDYTNLFAAFGNGGLGNKIVGTECVMYVPLTDTYYAIKFLSWTQNNNGGGFSYTRKEIDLTQLNQGIKFADGSVLKSANDINRIKSTAVGDRRIEEVSGYNQVVLTAVTTTNLTTVTSRSGSNTGDIWIDTTATTIDNVIDNPANYNNAYGFEFSLNDINWYPWNNSYGSNGNERGYGVNGPSMTYSQGDTVYFRYKTGGDPVVWWDKNDLPSGGSNFRGAVIDYHAFTGESTIIGTIHIVDDDGEEHITHTEVSSGSTDGENDDLWLVQNEGTISYRRIDGEGKTAKFHWTAKVFYGTEIWD